MTDLNQIQNGIDIYNEAQGCDNIFLKTLCESRKDDIIAVLGNRCGSILYDLCSDLNLSHPDLGKVFPKLLTDAILDGINVSVFCREKGLKYIYPHLRKMLKSEFREVEHEFDCLKVAARLFKHNKREALRQRKSIQLIDLSGVYKRGRTVWDGLPSDFNLYIRNSEFESNELEKYEKQVQRFKDLGCKSMSEEIQKYIDVFKQAFEEAYYGFRRITVTNAALICAKVNGYEWSNQIVNQVIQCNYEPAVYPSTCFLLPEKIIKIIGLLDTWPETGGCPIFDYYVLLIPRFRSWLSQLCDVEFLFKNNSITPVLLGEKDGKCYFISMVKYE